MVENDVETNRGFTPKQWAYVTNVFSARNIYSQHRRVLHQSIGIIIPGRIENNMRTHLKLGTNHGLTQFPRPDCIACMVREKHQPHWRRSKLPLLFRYLSTLDLLTIQKPASCPVVNVPNWSQLCLYRTLRLSLLVPFGANDCGGDVRSRAPSWTSGRAGRGMSRTSRKTIRSISIHTPMHYLIWFYIWFYHSTSVNYDNNWTVCLMQCHQCNDMQSDRSCTTVDPQCLSCSRDTRRKFRLRRERCTKPTCWDSTSHRILFKSVCIVYNTHTIISVYDRYPFCVPRTHTYNIILHTDPEVCPSPE